MNIYVVVNTYYDCNEVEVRTFESKKDAQDYAVHAYIEDSEYWSKDITKEDIAKFREGLEKDNCVHIDYTVDYSIYETALQFEKQGDQE